MPHSAFSAMFRMTTRSTPSALRLTALGFGVPSPIMSAATLISQRWCSSTTAHPYYVSRTKSDQLPVYSEYRNGRTRVLTILRRITGNYEALCDDIANEFQGVTILRKVGRLELKGRHSDQLKEFLESKGF